MLRNTMKIIRLWWTSPINQYIKFTIGQTVYDATKRPIRKHNSEHIKQFEVSH